MRRQQLGAQIIPEAAIHRGPNLIVAGVGEPRPGSAITGTSVDMTVPGNVASSRRPSGPATACWDRRRADCSETAQSRRRPSSRRLMAAMASRSRSVDGWAAGRSLPNLRRNFTPPARAARGRSEHAAANAVPARTRLRLSSSRPVTVRPVPTASTCPAAHHVPPRAALPRSWVSIAYFEFRIQSSEF